jgi:hypothetical protein
MLRGTDGGHSCEVALFRTGMISMTPFGIDGWTKEDRGQRTRMLEYWDNE